MREESRQAPRGRRPAHTPPAPASQEHADRSQPLWRRAASREAPSQPLLSRRDAPPAWPPSPDAPPVAAPVSSPLQRGGLPRFASYLAEDGQTYTLRDLAGGEEARVAKRRAALEPFPSTNQNRAPGAGLLRASGLALLGALLGGAPGIALGVVVALVALVRLARFERRARSWRAKAAQRDQAQRLPARATSERLRLMTALWQGLLALALGAAALILLLTALR